MTEKQETKYCGLSNEIVYEKNVYKKIIDDLDFQKLLKKETKGYINVKLKIDDIKTFIEKKINIVSIYFLLEVLLKDKTFNTDEYTNYEMKIIFIYHLLSDIDRNTQTFFKDEKIYYDIFKDFFKFNNNSMSEKIKEYIYMKSFSTPKIRLNLNTNDEVYGDHIENLINRTTLILNIMDSKYNYISSCTKSRYNDSYGYYNIIICDKNNIIVYISEPFKFKKNNYGKENPILEDAIKNINYDLFMDISDIICIKTKFVKLNGFLVMKRNKNINYIKNNLEDLNINKNLLKSLNSFNNISIDTFKNLQFLSPKLYNPSNYIKNIDEIHNVRLNITSMLNNIENYDIDSQDINLVIQTQSLVKGNKIPLNPSSCIKS